MTCIIALKDRDTGCVVMGGDSASMTETYHVRIFGQPKVFVNRGFLIGYTTSFRMGQVLQHKFIPPRIPRRGELLKYMVGDFVDAVRKAFGAAGFSMKDESGAEVGGSFLVGIRGRIFQIEGDFQVAEYTDGYAAVGCGADYALGSLAESRDSGKNTCERVISALQIAEKFSGGVRAPFHFVTDDKRTGNANLVSQGGMRLNLHFPRP